MIELLIVDTWSITFKFDRALYCWTRGKSEGEESEFTRFFDTSDKWMRVSPNCDAGRALYDFIKRNPQYLR